jgi:tetratricopeptide (TPR) repeat protein
MNLKRSAKENGNVYAQIHLAGIYFYGQENIFHFNEKKAFYWAQAYDLLGFMYRKCGNFNTAIQYYKLGALQKNYNCIEALVQIYENRKDFRQALKYRRAIKYFSVVNILMKNGNDYNCLYHYGQFHPNYRYIFELINQSTKNVVMYWMLIYKELNICKDVAKLIGKLIFKSRKIDPGSWIME